MTYTRGAALALLVASASLVPLSEASARCWRWHCGPPLIALPFVAAGAVVAGAAAIATAPIAAIAGAPYYGRGYYYPRRAYYYGPPPGYGYYGYYQRPDPTGN